MKLDQNNVLICNCLESNYEGIPCRHEICVFIKETKSTSCLNINARWTSQFFNVEQLEEIGESEDEEENVQEDEMEEDFNFDQEEIKSEEEFDDEKESQLEEEVDHSIECEIIFNKESEISYNQDWDQNSIDSKDCDIINEKEEFELEISDKKQGRTKRKV